MTVIDITEDDDGTTVAAAVGDTLRLRLPDNPTTGYAWELESVSDTSIEQLDYSYASSSDRAGSPGIATWAFEAKSPGPVEVRLKRLRPWEGDTSVLARFTVTIEIGA